MAQSGGHNDSTAVVQEFIRNAKPILDSLTKLHFRTVLLGQTASELKRVTAEKNAFASQLIRCSTDAMNAQVETQHLASLLGRERRKRRWNQVQKWAAIGLSTWLGYRQLRPFLPP